MQIVSTIRVGHTIITEDNAYLVIGSMQMRGRYSYTARDKSGRKVSLGREDVLQGQRDGLVKIAA